MELNVDSVPLEMDATELTVNLRPPRLQHDLMTLFDDVRPLIQPRAAYTTTKVRGFEHGDVVRFEEGHSLKGVLLSDMLEVGQVVIPYVVTIGPGLEDAIAREKNMVRLFLMERIGNYALHKAFTGFKSRVAERLSWQGWVSEFSPGTGTGELFGIDQQTPLFGMLGSGATSIGVRLSPGLMMIPRKSESGVLATTPKEYVACARCPRAGCDSRCTPYIGPYQRIKEARVNHTLA